MDKYYVVKTRAIPEVLVKVVEVKKLLESNARLSVKDATDIIGISRSSFYKYRDDIFPFEDHSRGKTITVSVQCKDEPGALSGILKEVADCGANILTIHQSVPVSGIATASLSLEMPVKGGSISELVNALEQHEDIKSVKILAGA